MDVILPADLDFLISLETKVVRIVSFEYSVAKINELEGNA